MTLPEDELAGIEVIAVSDAPSFDGDPRAFRLGVEAPLIENAFRRAARSVIRGLGLGRPQGAGALCLTPLGTISGGVTEMQFPG